MEIFRRFGNFAENPMFTFDVGTSVRDIALSKLSTRTCGTNEKGFRHVEEHKMCRRKRRKLKEWWNIASNYRNSGISMEEEERRRLHPVKSKKINLMKKDVLASKKSKEAEKQLKTIALQRPCSVQLERIKIQNLLSPSQISSIFGQHLQRRSTPTKKETIKDLVRMIKSEPEENRNKTAAPGIRMLLEKTHRRRCAFFFFRFVRLFKIYFLRYAVAFISSLTSSHENLTIGDKVSTKEKPLHKFDLEEPAPQQTKRNPENSLSCDEKNSRKNKCSKEESQSAQCHKLKKRIKAYSDEKSGIVDSITIVKVVKSEYSEIGPTPKVEVGSEYCEIVPRVQVKSEYSENVPRVKEESEHFGMVPSAEVKSEYSEIFPPFEEVKHQCEEFVHLSKGTLNLQVPSRLVGVWVAFDSTFLPTLNTVFVFRLNKDRQVQINTLI